MYTLVSSFLHALFTYMWCYCYFTVVKHNRIVSNFVPIQKNAGETPGRTISFEPYYFPPPCSSVTRKFSPSTNRVPQNSATNWRPSTNWGVSSRRSLRASYSWIDWSSCWSRCVDTIGSNVPWDGLYRTFYFKVDRVSRLEMQMAFCYITKTGYHYRYSTTGN